MKKLKNTTALMVLLLLVKTGTAQQKNFPLNRQWSIESDAETLLDTSVRLHSAMKPWIETAHFQYSDYIAMNRDYANFSCSGDTSAKFMKRAGAWCCRKHHFEPFVAVRHSGEDAWFNLSIDPLMHFEYSKRADGDTSAALIKNTRGIRAYGDIGNKFSFETSFWENQATYEPYIVAFNNYYKVVPGQGRWKRFKTNGYDFAMASGYVSYSPCRKFNMQFGHGKHFVGDGYRSLLLSDNGFSYPYARFTTRWRSFQYTNLYASLMNLVPGGNNIPPATERLFQKKAAAFHQISASLFKKKRLQLTLFQGIIWDAADTNNRQHLNFHYFNPVMFTSLPAYGLNSARNAILGASFKWRFMRSIEIYGQYVLDEKGKKNTPGDIHNKTGFQLGAKYFNAFRIRHLHLQYEYNQVRPYTYATRDTLQNWSHYNQALAHPLGANFREQLVFVNYKIRDFYIELKYMNAQQGADSTSKSMGSDLFASDHSGYFGVNSTVNELLQGKKVAITNQELRVGYMVSYATNLNVYVSISKRIYEADGVVTGYPYINLGLRTSLQNLYWDF